jgi:3-dehydroquinate synthase
MKAAIVAEDEREGGARALLNLGHTFAHAIEAETGFGEALKHGEAVGLGCALAFRFSAALGLCEAEASRRVALAIGAAGLPTTLAAVRPEPFSARALLAHMKQDKKASDGGVTLILARAIGDAFVQRNVDEERLGDFLVAEGAAS